jgi:MFS family permease
VHGSIIDLCSRERCSHHGPQRAKALGVWGAVGGAGAAIGVLLGGALTELADWRAMFFINLPIGALLAA